MWHLRVVALWQQARSSKECAVKTFRCPECGKEQVTRGRAVWHKCGGKVREFEEVKDDGDT